MVCDGDTGGERVSDKIQTYIMEFAEEVCPGFARLYMATFTEEQCLKDATATMRESRVRITALEAENAALHAERNAAINEVMGFLHITHDTMISWADAADEIVSAIAGLRAEVEALKETKGLSAETLQVLMGDPY